MSPIQALSDNHRSSAELFDLCFEKLICVLRNWFCVWRNWFVFWEIDLCFEKWYVFWETGLCFEKLICVFEKLICVLRHWFVFWETGLCLEKLICVLRNWFVFWEIDLCFELELELWTLNFIDNNMYIITKLLAPATSKMTNRGGGKGYTLTTREKFWEIDSRCFEKLVCVLRNWFVFWEIGLCFEKLICVLRNWFVFCG